MSTFVVFDLVFSAAVACSGCYRTGTKSAVSTALLMLNVVSYCFEFCWHAIAFSFVDWLLLVIMNLYELIECRSSRLLHTHNAVDTGLLLRPRELVCVCVCVSVCLSVCLFVRQHISGITLAIFFQIFHACCLLPWLGPPPAGCCNPKGNKQFWRFSSPLTMHCTAWHLGPIRKRLNRSKCRLVNDFGGP